jgi:HxlR-like helix-turn-helix
VAGQLNKASCWPPKLTIQHNCWDGFVRREMFPEMPVRVEYSLTPFGKKIQPLLAGDRFLGAEAFTLDMDVSCLS